MLLLLQLNERHRSPKYGYSSLAFRLFLLALLAITYRHVQYFDVCFAFYALHWF